VAVGERREGGKGSRDEAIAVPIWMMMMRRRKK